MSNNKRYYWLKLMKDFFIQARIKKLRRIAGGDTYVIIYLKLMLLSINTDGVITFESIENTIEEELALILDEEVKNIEVVLAYLIANKLCQQISNNKYDLKEVQSLIGSETATAERMRKSRERKKQNTLKCNNVTPKLHDVTKGYTEKELELELTTTTINNKYIKAEKAGEIYQALVKGKDFTYEYNRFKALNEESNRTVENWKRWCMQIKKFSLNQINQKGETNG